MFTYYVRSFPCVTLVVASATLAACATASQPSVANGELAFLSRATPVVADAPQQKVGAWAIDANSYHLIGLTSNLKHVVQTIDFGTSCSDAATDKVDHGGNVWIACKYDGPGENGGVTEYSRDGSPEANYILTCPGTDTCELSESFAADAAVNATDAFVSAPVLEYRTCPTPSQCNPYGGTGIEFWPLHNPTAPAVFFNVYKNGTAGLLISTVSYFDVDNSNIYFSYQGCEVANPSICGNGLAEIQNYASSANAVMLLPPGTFDQPGTVWVGGHGSFVAVLDPSRRKLFKYALPFTGSPEATYGPMKTVGSLPSGGGFNVDDSKFVAAGGWSDDQGLFAVIRTSGCTHGCIGVSYTPSDK